MTGQADPALENLFDHLETAEDPPDAAGDFTAFVDAARARKSNGVLEWLAQQNDRHDTHDHTITESEEN